MPILHQDWRVAECNLQRVEGDAADWCDTLTHEALVVLDGAQSLTGVVHHTHKLVCRPAAATAQHTTVSNTRQFSTDVTYSTASYITNPGTNTVQIVKCFVTSTQQLGFVENVQVLVGHIGQ